MKRLTSLLLILIIAIGCVNMANGQSLMQTAKKAEQRAKELRKEETSRYNAIVDSRDITKYNQYIKDYPRGKNTPEIKRRVDELNKWNNATSKHTIDAYQNYLNSTQYHWYDEMAKNNINVMRRAQEKERWDKVATVNTISAYKTYLSENPNSGYRSEAEAAIKKLESKEVWEIVKNSNDIQALQGFITKYPNTSECEIAEEKLHELRGALHYKNGQLEAAYKEFSKVDRNKISYSNRQAYDATIEYDAFSRLSVFSPAEFLYEFLRKYTESKYADQVSNMVAEKRALNLGPYATSYDYNQALYYATDQATKKTVQRYIDQNKHDQKQRIKYRKSYERKQNGGWVNIGCDFLDIGMGGGLFDSFVYYYNLGIMLRLGNYKDRIQFALGVKPGIVGYSYEHSGKYYYNDYDYTYENGYGFHLPIIAQLKLNLFKMSKSSRFFVDGKYQYNAVRHKEFEGKMAWGAGFGFAWKHFDLSFYYRNDLGSYRYSDYSKQHYVGTSMIYYWQI